VSVSLGNLLGSLKWNKDVKVEEGFIRDDSLTVVEFDEDLVDSTWSYDGVPFMQTPPPVLRVGCAYQEGPVILTLDYCQGFGKGAWISTKPRCSLGTEWSGLSWLPLRMGVVMGGRIGFGTAFGFGLRMGGFVLDFGLINRGFFIPNKSKGLIAALELGIDLQKRESNIIRVSDF
jgi:hypothetical protein